MLAQKTKSPDFISSRCALRLFTTILLLALSTSAFAKMKKFPPFALKQIDEWNYCDKAEDCATTGYYKDNYLCPALCSSGDIVINKSKREEFIKFVDSINSDTEPCPVAKCMAWKPPTFACVNKKCVSKKQLPKRVPQK